VDQRCRKTDASSLFALLLVATLAFPSLTHAVDCHECDAPLCDCVGSIPVTVLGDMGCPSADLTNDSGSDTMPGVMSDCQCHKCNSTRFANQFRKPIDRCQAYRPQCLAIGRALAFTRVTPSPGVLINDTTNPMQQLNRDSLSFGWEPGIDLTIRREHWTENAFEVRFTGIDQLEATSRVTVGGPVEIHAAVPIFAPDITSIDTRYESDLYSLEANWHFVTYCPFRYIAGLRYLGFDEELTALMDSPTVPMTYRTHTRNDLYGVQVGITSIPDVPLLDCKWLTWSAKLGLYGNDAEQTTILEGTVGQRTDAPADAAAFVGEFHIGMELPLTHHLTISSGYGMLILERVAIASDQLQSTDLFSGTGSDNEGNALFHGARAAITVRY